MIKFTGRIKKGLTQEEWDAPITHTKFTVTYEAKINKEPADTNQFVNVATAKGSNTDEVKDDEIVYLKTPVIKTEKESDKDSYQKGETAKYHLNCNTDKRGQNCSKCSDQGCFKR